MALPARLRSRLRALVLSESGMALPTALFAMIASFGFASVAVMSSVDAQHGTARDRSSKNAIAAADAGAGVALLRLNRFQKKLTAATPCIGPAGETQTPTEGWCPTTAAETVGGATFSYRFSAFQPNSEMSVVAVGSSGGVSRRVNVKLAAKIEENVFKAEQLIGESNINLEGGPTLETDLGTNGSVELTSNGNSYVLCGDVRHGIGKTAPIPGCEGKVTEGNKTLPPVVPPENIATSNSNCRLVPNCSKAEEVDVYQGQARTATKPWDATQRFINVPTGASLTLGGGDYWICGLFVNGTLYMAADRQIRIFFDTPEHCSGLDSNHTQVNVSASATIQSTGFGTTGGTYNVPGLYLMGSPTITTTVTLTGSAGGLNEVMVYAPNSNIEISGNATWIGMFAGKSIRMNGNPTVKTDARIPLPEEFYVGLLERTRYVECVGATGSPPDVNC